MGRLGLGLVLVLCATHCAFGDDNRPIRQPRGGLLARSFKVGDVWCTLPEPELPTTAEILRALSEDKVVRKNPRVKCEVIVNKLEPPRDFPLVGQSRMQRIHFKCTVESDQGSETVYVDRDHLIPPIEFPTASEILRALPDEGAVRRNPRFRCEMIVFKQEPAKEYPLVGRARLVKAHFRCTVVSDQGKEMVYVDYDRLLPWK